MRVIHQERWVLRKRKFFAGVDVGGQSRWPQQRGLCQSTATSQHKL